MQDAAFGRFDIDVPGTEGMPRVSEKEIYSRLSAELADLYRVPCVFVLEHGQHLELVMADDPAVCADYLIERRDASDVFDLPATCAEDYEAYMGYLDEILEIDALVTFEPAGFVPPLPRSMDTIEADYLAGYLLGTDMWEERPAHYVKRIDSDADEQDVLYALAAGIPKDKVARHIEAHTLGRCVSVNRDRGIDLLSLMR